MALKSMTGFARSEGAEGPLLWQWEARTLNSRGLDIRMRLPSGFEAIEAKVRDICKGHFSRGNCSVNLVVKRSQESGRLRLNEMALKDAASIVEKARKIVAGPEPSLDTLLALKGVVEFADDEGEGQSEDRFNVVLADLGKALDGVEASRLAEGKHLETAISAHVDEIEELAAKIETSPASSPEAILERLDGQISRLLQTSQDFDRDRLHQEAALLATKADIAEELDRLRAHVASARELLALDRPTGRKFEFLAQEFNREANTICSKSNDGGVTKSGLAMKAVIDRLREQVQNVE